jgi:hypothetical protein
MTIEENIKALLEKEIEDYSPESHQVRISEKKGSDLFSLDYQTCWNDDYSSEHGVLPIFYILSQPEYAGRINKISIAAEDEGVNGTQNWELNSLLENDALFDNLEEFILPLNDAENHHRKIVTNDDSYDEKNALGLLLDKAKNLKKLVAPSAPEPKFFERKSHGLKELNLQSGYDHQNFIANLSKSTCFKDLTSLTFRDYAETYMDDYKDSCTKFDDYLALVNSDTLPSLKSITLIDTVLDKKQKETLTKAASAKGRALEFKEIGK